jgi:glycosyltransferase involved in cell wall biosynthesis
MREIATILDALPPSIVIIESIPIPYRALKRHVHFQVAYDFRYFTGDSKGLLYRLVFSNYLKRAWKRAEYMVTSSEFSIDELKRYVGYDPARVVKSFFGIDERVLTLAQAPMPEKEYDVIYVGHFERRKNHAPLLRAIALVDKGLRVILIGRDNGMKAEIAELARTLGLTGVEFGPAVDDTTLWQLYRKSRVFAYPSIYEGFGIPTIEALALGVPAIIADIPVFHEVGADLVTYFDPHDPSDIADSLRKVLEAPQIPPPERVRAHLSQFFWGHVYERFAHDLKERAKRRLRNSQ